MSARRISSWMLAAALALGAALHVQHYVAPFEDSFITYRYARNVARGLGIVYNAGERVEGCTSLAWTLSLAVFAKAGLPLPGTATALSVLSAAALLSLTGRAAQLFAPRPGPAILLAPALVAANGTFAYFAGTGMETAFFSLLVLGAVTIAARDRPGGGVPLGLMLGLASATRPEGAGYAAVLLATLGLEPSGRARLKHAGPVFAALFGALCAFRYAYFGDLLPNTYYAKAAPSLALWLAGLGYVEEYVTFWGGALAAAAFASLRLASRRGHLGTWTAFHRLAVAVSAAAVVNSIVVGGDTFAFHRFLLPAVPLAAAITAHAAQLWLDGGAVRRRTVYVGAPALLLWSTVAAFCPRYSFSLRAALPFESIRRSVAIMNQRYFVVGEWLRAHLPNTATLAVNAAGIVPYVSDLATIDMLGLTDAHIARRPVPLGKHFHGHEKYDPDYVLDRSPDVIIPGLPTLSEARVRVGTLAEWYAPWAPYMPGDALLLGNARLGEKYTLRVPRVHESGHLVMFVKKSSPLARSIQSAP